MSNFEFWRVYFNFFLSLASVYLTGKATYRKFILFKKSLYKSGYIFNFALKNVETFEKNICKSIFNRDCNKIPNSLWRVVKEMFNFNFCSAIVNHLAYLM